MKISTDKAAQNRQAVVDAASRLFRERGFDGVSVKDLMAAAGFTCGGFYNHFETKEALAAEVCRTTFAGAGCAMGQALAGTARAGAPDPLGQRLGAYLSAEHRDSPGIGCPTAALATDVARQGGETQAAFARGLEDYISTFEAALEAPDVRSGEIERDTAERRRVASALVAQIVGALILSRAVAEASPALADELLAASREAVVMLRTSPVATKKRRKKRR